jgi:mannose-6-phosphate isomerase-like protein (cupin superfamily)
MNYKPTDFFLGVVDVFAVLLPGAVLTFFIQGHWYADFFGTGKIFPAIQSDAEKVLAFLIVTYTLGNIIFLAASLLMDGWYDRLIRNLFKKNADLAYHTATAIKEKYLHSQELIDDLLLQNKFSQKEKNEIQSSIRKEVVNTYKWIQHFMRIRQPEALTDIQKLEADSKFFRCLIITFLFIAAFSFAYFESSVGALFLLLSFFSVYRYADLRNKSTQRAYEFLITYYYLNYKVETNSAIANTNKLKEVLVNKEESIKVPAIALTDELDTAHVPLVRHLKKGLNKSVYQLTIPSGKPDRKYYTAEKEEYWYCLKGKGLLHFENEGSHMLIPNGTIVIEKDKRYSFINKLQEPLELVVLKY